MSRGKHFSAEEIEFIKVNALVMTTTEIAKQLNRRPKSVDNALQRIKRKMEKCLDMET